MKAIIVGAGTYGEVILEYLVDAGVEVVGFLDDRYSHDSPSVRGVPILGSTALLANAGSVSADAAFVAIGNNQVRSRLLSAARAGGLTTPRFIHPASHLSSSVVVGQGSYVLPGATIMPHVEIQENCIISTGVNIAHHTVVGRGSLVSSGATVGAGISIGDFAFLGIGCTVMTGVKSIGSNAVVGAGAVVIRDVAPGSTVVGVPAKALPAK